MPDDPTHDTSWTWEEVDSSRSGSSGDVSKLFRNTQVKRPGIFAAVKDAPSLDATVMAREVVQNSWDAARDHRSQEAGTGLPQSEFELEFRFEELTGDAARRMAGAVDLHGLRARAREVEEAETAQTLGLPSTSIVGTDDEHLRVLRIIESGTTGMYGRWSDATSKMYHALVSIGFTQKGVGSAGGSYGYGKAGLIRGSRARVVLAYSCFDATEGATDQPADQATRRLLGMAYWSPHETSAGKSTGFGRLGRPTSQGVVPFEDEEADRIAEALGMEVRSLDSQGSTGKGTTFIVLDPTVAPDHLQRALEDSWWPAIVEDDDFDLTVIDYDGEQHFLAPNRRDHLRAFIRGFELALTKPDAELDEEDHYEPNRLALGNGKLVALGTLGLKAETQNWSYPKSDDIDHRSLVALVRGPRMVVEYADMGRARPYVRGTFVADDSVDEHLRQTEPPAHDAWIHASQDEDIPVDARAVAEAIQKRARGRVDRFRNNLRPPKVDSKQVRLPEFEKLFGKFLSSDGGGDDGPDPVPRDVLLNVVDQDLEPYDGGIRMTGRFRFALSPRVEEETAKARVRITYKFEEDGRASTAVPLEFDAPSGFEKDKNGFFVGQLDHDGIEIDVRSTSYDADWTARLTLEGELVRTLTDKDTADVE